MTLQQFLKLTIIEQAKLLYNDGVYIGKRRLAGNVIIAFQLSSFYVEVYYLKYRCFISRLECFTSTERLSPYLDQVEIYDDLKLYVEKD